MSPSKNFCNLLYTNDLSKKVKLHALLLIHLCRSPPLLPMQDTICCVCLKNIESSHMVACKQCSHWSHSKCVGISISLAASFPFVCPFCVKTIFSELSSIRASISNACSRLSDIESSYSDSIPPVVQRELNRISDSLLLGHTPLKTHLLHIYVSLRLP